MGGNGYASAGPRYGGDAALYQDYTHPQYDYYQDDNRLHCADREISPTPRRCSWIVEAMERLSADIKSCGFEPRKSPKAEAKPKAEEKSSEKDNAVIESMSAKLTKLENAMKSVQDTLQSCLERARRGQEDGVGAGGRREIRSPVWRQRRFRSPDRFLYAG